MPQSNINDKYKFFKTAIILFILILLVCVADLVLYASQDILSNISKNIAATFFILLFFIILFAFGWFIWFFYKADLFEEATAFINKSIDSILKLSESSASSSSSSSSSSYSSNKKSNENPFYLFLRYLVFFLGLAFTGAFMFFFVNTLGYVSPSYSIISVFLLSILSTILALFSIYFLFYGALFDLTWENINKNKYNISLIFYVLFTGLLLYYDPWNVMRKNIGIIIAVSVLFLAFIFPLIYSSYYETVGFTKSSVATVIENSVKVLFSLGISGLVIYGIYYLLTTGLSFLTSDFGVFSYVINMALIVVGLAFLYKFLNRNDTIRKMPPIGRLIVNSFLYIPCLFTIFIDLGIAAFTPGKDRTYLILALIMMAIMAFLLIKPRIEKKYILQGGKLIHDKPPLPLNQEKKLSGYHELNDPPKKKKNESNFSMSKTWDNIKETTTYYQDQGSELENHIETDYYKDKKLNQQSDTVFGSIGNFMNKHLHIKKDAVQGVNLTCATPPPPTPIPNQSQDHFAYRYSLSSWIFLDAKPPNTNLNYNKFVSLLNYGNKPNIMYRAATNTLRIIVSYKNLKEATEIEREDIQVDEHGNRVVLEYKEIPLQKWNNIIINNTGGTLDIFINGELVGTANNIVPYMNYDSLTCGTKDGVDGKICSVVYYKHPLNKDEIAIVYESSKEKDPPTFPAFFPTFC
jgi:hypothetical protein